MRFIKANKAKKKKKSNRKIPNSTLCRIQYFGLLLKEVLDLKSTHQFQVPKISKSKGYYEAIQTTRNKQDPQVIGRIFLIQKQLQDNY